MGGHRYRPAVFLGSQSASENNPPQTMIAYRREIDGLRAVAVLPVILFHAGIGGFGGGYVGVDVFFVISGYLITSIILGARAEGGFSLIHFYERRARRILPALFFMIAVCLPVAWIWLLPADMRNFAQSVAAVSLFASNFLFWWQSGYFAAAAEMKPLLHSWSLAVEEQYYLFFPVLMLLLWRFAPRRVGAALLVIALASLAASHWMAYAHPAAAFFLLPTRAWELAIGALLALHHAGRSSERPAGRFREWGGIAGLCLIAAAVVGYDKSTPFPSLYALAPTLGAAMVIEYATAGSLAGRLLGSRLLVGIGLVSYSAYLWHQPVLVFARYIAPSPPGLPLLAGLILLSFVLAAFTWRYVERPFRNPAIIGRRGLWLSALCIGLLFLGFGVAGHVTKGFESYYLDHRLNEDQKAALRIIQAQAGRDIYEHMADNGDCVFWSRRITPEVERRYADCTRRFGPGVVVLGDSHAMNIYNLLAKAGAAQFILGVSQGACRPHDNLPQCHYDGFDEFLTKNGAAIRGIIYHQSGSYLIRDQFGQVDSKYLFEPETPFALSEANAGKVEAYLDRLARYAKVKWFGPFVEGRVQLNNYRILSMSMTVNPKSIEQFGRLDAALKAQSARPGRRYEYVSLVDLMQIRESSLFAGDCIIYNDTDHLSVCGEDLFARALVPQLRAAAAFE